MIRHVLIAGDNSTGWLAALAMRRALPEAVISVVGTGTAEFPALLCPATGVTYLHQSLALAAPAFLGAVRPLWSLGIRYAMGGAPFVIHFGPGPDQVIDPALPQPAGFYFDGNLEDADVLTAMIAQQRIFGRDQNGQILFHSFFGYSINAARLSAHLKQVAVERGVTAIDGVLGDAELNEEGIAAVIAGERRITADLYVDASGAEALLMQRVDAPFTSFVSSLPCDRMILVRRARRESAMLPCNSVQAGEAGVFFLTQHEHELIGGYLYSSRFTSDEQARVQVGTAIPGSEIVSAGAHEPGMRRRWHKNVVAVGEAAGVVDPIHTAGFGITATQCRLLADSLYETDATPLPTQIALLNQHYERTMRWLCGFTSLFYRFGQRASPFWEDCRASVDVGSAARVVEYFQANGPSTYWEPVMFEDHAPVRMARYVSALLGMNVPHENHYVPTPAEAMAWQQRRQTHRNTAASALTLKEVFELVHSPETRWVSQ